MPGHGLLFSSIPVGDQTFPDLKDKSSVSEAMYIHERQIYNRDRRSMCLLVMKIPSRCLGFWASLDQMDEQRRRFSSAPSPLTPTYTDLSNKETSVALLPSHNGNFITGAWMHPLLSWLGCGRVRQWLRNECQSDLGSSGCDWLKDVLHMKATRIKMLFVVFRAGWYDSILTEMVVLCLAGDILGRKASCYLPGL